MCVRWLFVTLALAVAVAVVPMTGSGEPGQAGREDCQMATQLRQLAAIYGSAELEMITKETGAICVPGTAPRAAIRWPNKQPLKSSGTWYYPNENPAFSSGTWRYPNKELANSSGRWYYPDGNEARSSQGRWTRPDRDVRRLSAVELREWACRRAPATECARLSPTIGEGNTDDEALAAIELAWMAR